MPKNNALEKERRHESKKRYLDRNKATTHKYALIHPHKEDMTMSDVREEQEHNERERIERARTQRELEEREYEERQSEELAQIAFERALLEREAESHLHRLNARLGAITLTSDKSLTCPNNNDAVLVRYSREINNADALLTKRDGPYQSKNKKPEDPHHGRSQGTNSADDNGTKQERDERKQRREKARRRSRDAKYGFMS